MRKTCSYSMILQPDLNMTGAWLVNKPILSDFEQKAIYLVTKSQFGIDSSRQQENSLLSWVRLPLAMEASSLGGPAGPHTVFCCGERVLDP